MTGFKYRVMWDPLGERHGLEIRHEPIDGVAIGVIRGSDGIPLRFWDASPTSTFTLLDEELSPLADTEFNVIHFAREEGYYSSAHKPSIIDDAAITMTLHQHEADLYPIVHATAEEQTFYFSTLDPDARYFSYSFSAWGLEVGGWRFDGTDYDFNLEYDQIGRFVWFDREIPSPPC